MKNYLFYFLGLVIILANSCKNNNFRDEEYVQIPDFDFQKSIKFKESLSEYKIFEGLPSDLVPSKDFHLLELSSKLFTDYAHKQRLVKLPAGTKMKKLEDGSVEFPNGTILTKTFFYYNDERDKSLGKQIIETRLEIKENDIWNVATYIWNKQQTDATIETNGLETKISWISDNGTTRSTNYQVPTENQCMTCHQSNSKMTPLGPTLRNLNRTVYRDSTNLNQIDYLQSVGILNEFDISQINNIVDYKNTKASLTERSRAYLDMNCAHCHNPKGWDESTQRRFDFRYETPLEQTGFLRKKEKVVNTMMRGKMPFIGTTMLDEEGIELINEFTGSL